MTKRLVIFALSVITFAVAPQALKADDADAFCPLGNATLSGTYMLRGEGTIVGVGPLTVLDGSPTMEREPSLRLHDGKRERHDFYVYSFRPLHREQRLHRVPRTVRRQHYNMVVGPDGKTVSWIETDPGTVSSGTEVRLTRRLDHD